jgi:hypothetical protein
MATNARNSMRRVLALLSLAVVAGCCCQAVPLPGENECPTDARRLYLTCGEEAVRKCPCGPDGEFYGLKPTTWREWPEGWRYAQYGAPPYGDHACAAPTCEEPAYGTPAASGEITNPFRSKDWANRHAPHPVPADQTVPQPATPKTAPAQPAPKQQPPANEPLEITPNKLMLPEDSTVQPTQTSPAVTPPAEKPPEQPLPPDNILPILPGSPPPASPPAQTAPQEKKPASQPLPTPPQSAPATPNQDKSASLPPINNNPTALNADQQKPSAPALTTRVHEHLRHNVGL